MATRAIAAAAARAATAPGFGALLRGSLLQTVSVVFNVIPAAMALATLTAVLVFHTPVFEWLSWPLAWVLDLFSFPEAVATAPGLLAGFLDQFMPALIAANLESELARFVLAGLSVTQLIFMAEVGVLILRSSLPLGLKDLVFIFVLRTLIAFPLLTLTGLWLTT